MQFLQFLALEKTTRTPRVHLVPLETNDPGTKNPGHSNFQ